MSQIPRAQEIYKHFKGNLYQIVTVAEHTETGEAMVVYQAMYGEFKVYVRPLSMFCSKVDKEKYPQAKQEYRFEKQTAWQPPETTEEIAVQDNTVKTVLTNEQPVTIGKKEEPEQKSVTETPVERQEELSEAELSLDPMLLAFLDAETYAEKLNILAGMHHRITDDMITTMAVANDIEVEDGDLEERYGQLKNCLMTLEKYEITRLR